MSDLLSQVCKVENLPSLPKVAMEVLRLTRDENVSVDAIAKVIQNDPALSGKLLKVVNSALFGLPRPVASIRQAMVILGLRTVKVMALSFSVVDALAGKAVAGFDMELYWKRSLCSAVAGRLLGKAVAPGQSEEAFVAGLLADIGMCALWKCAESTYSAVLEQTAGGMPLHEAEHAKLGFGHARASAALLKAWNLPEAVCAAVAAHHDAPGSAGPDSSLKSVVHAAAAIADVFCGTGGAGDVSRVREQTIVRLGIEPPRMDEVLAGLTKFVNETAALLSVRIGKLTSYAELQAAAAAQLVTLSVQAEVDRASATRDARATRAANSRLEEEKRSALQQASTDSLTRIANRAAFDQRLKTELDRAVAARKPLSLILMDVDHFKRFNDTHGHQAGDAVLCDVAACLQDVARGAALVARYGGEEFAVIVNQSAAEVRGLAEQIRSAIERRSVEHAGKRMNVTASFGIADTTAGKSDVSPTQLVELADRQLYQAKRNGRNRVETHAP